MDSLQLACHSQWFGNQKRGGSHMRWWGVLLWLLSGQAWAANVLVIQSYHSGYAWDAAYTTGLKEGI
ncbi:hypothetical protein EC575_20865, partial [Vibrio cholerae]